MMQNPRSLTYALLFFLLTICLAACQRQEYGAPCDADDDCERKLECRSAESVPQSAMGQMCSEACENDDDCNCWYGTCVRECEVTASDCPDGTICAVLTAEFSVIPQGYCVLPCLSPQDCDGDAPYCPQPGGPCSRVEGEAPPWI